MPRTWTQKLRRIPAVGAAILGVRRLAGSDRIHRVLVTAPDDALIERANARVWAQPLAVVDATNTYLWAYAPQLKRSPSTADILWKTLPPPLPLPGRTLFGAVDGFSYYHWLLGTLPKLLLARSRGHDLAAFDHIIVTPRHKGKANFQTETLAILGLELNKIKFIDRGFHRVCTNLVLPPEACFREQTDAHPWALELLRAAFLPLAAPPQAAPRRLFIRRASARRRRLVDEAAIEAALVHLGFTPVTLEALPWREQIGLFAQAEAVVGLHGAGLANLAFVAPGTRVVEILPNVWRNPCFANLAARVGATYANLGARPSGERTGFAADAVVDLPELLAVLKLTIFEP